MDKDTNITKLSHLEKIVTSLRKTHPIQDIEISFEYLIASCFPQCYKNIMKQLEAEHTIGFKEGYEAAKAEQENK